MKRIKRQLTHGEKLIVESVFGETVNSSVVRIVRGGWLFLFFPVITAYVIRNHIYVNAPYYKPDFSKEELVFRGVLVHEVMHVWQYQNLPSYHYLKAVLENMRYPVRCYEYGELDPKMPLTDFRYEQQGRIVQDYYKRRERKEDVAAYEAVIYRSIKPPNKFS